MNGDEHLYFFPVIVLIALILIALSFKLIFRLLMLFFIVIGVWYCLYYFGLANEPLKRAPKQEVQKNV